MSLKETAENIIKEQNLEGVLIAGFGEESMQISSMGHIALLLLADTLLAKGLEQVDKADRKAMAEAICIHALEAVDDESRSAGNEEEDSEE